MMFSQSRLNLLDKGVTDLEKEANVRLTEIDKGLWSPDRGRQCQSVLECLDLLDKYPFPILINSVFVRLADLFHSDSAEGFVRFYIWQVIKQSEKHYEKVTSTSLFTDHIFSVIYSNDFGARAITLRLLGTIATMIPPSKIDLVQHSVLSALDSTSNIELQAAVEAAGSLAAISIKFADALFPKLEAMLLGMNTFLEIKLKILDICSCMHQTSHVADQTRDLCIRAMAELPVESFTTKCLTILTALALKHRPHVISQVELLLNSIASSPDVNLPSVFSDLSALASSAPHLWKCEFVKELSQYSVTCSNSQYTASALNCLAVLFNQPAQNILSFSSNEMDSSSEILQILDTATTVFFDSNEPFVSLRALQLIGAIARCLNLSPSASSLVIGSVWIEKLVVFVEQSLAGLLQNDESSVACIEEYLLTLIAVTIQKRIPSSVKLGEALITVLESSITNFQLSQGKIEPVLKAFILLGKTPHLEIPFQAACLRVCAQLETCLNENFQFNVSNSLLFISLICLSEQLPNEQLETLVTSLLLSHDVWTAYRASRLLVYKGYFGFAAQLLGTVKSQTTDDRYTTWLTGLEECLGAEAELVNSARSVKHDNHGTTTSAFLSSFGSSLSRYQRGCVYLSSSSVCRRFQTEYIKCRISLFSMIYELLLTLSTASWSSSTTSTEPNKHLSHVVSSKLIQLAALQRSTEQLRCNSFDSDRESLVFVQVYRLVADVLHLLTSGLIVKENDVEGFLSEFSKVAKRLLRYCSAGRLIALKNGILNIVCSPFQYSTVKDVRLSCRNRLQGFMLLVLGCSVGYPRYFLQIRRVTNIKLAFTPQNKSNLEPIPLNFGTQFVLKVEGVITIKNLSARPTVTRRIASVITDVSCQRNRSKPQHQINDETPKETQLYFKSIVQPKHDYFATQLAFLLPPIPGPYTISVSISLTDHMGIKWDMPSLGGKLQVRSLDDQHVRSTRPALK